MAEIVDALHEADVLNNSTGNLPIRAIEKLVAERDAARAEVEAAAESAFRYCYAMLDDFGHQPADPIITKAWEDYRDYQRTRGTR
jgi:hypothetical protein